MTLLNLGEHHTRYQDMKDTGMDKQSMDVELTGNITESFNIGMTVKAKIRSKWKISIVHKEYNTGYGSQRYQVRPLNGTSLNTLAPSDIK